MLTLTNHPTLNVALNKIFEHSDAVRKGEDSDIAAKRIFTAPRAISTGDNSVCCNAPAISDGLHTWCEECGEYCRIVQDKPLAF